MRLCPLPMRLWLKCLQGCLPIGIQWMVLRSALSHASLAVSCCLMSVLHWIRAGNTLSLLAVLHRSSKASIVMPSRHCAKHADYASVLTGPCSCFGILGADRSKKEEKKILRVTRQELMFSQLPACLGHNRSSQLAPSLPHSSCAEKCKKAMVCILSYP